MRLARHYDVSARRVFDAWLDPAIAARWLFATAGRPHAWASIDARVGGAFRFESRQGGTIVAYRGEYRELVADRRLVFLLALGGERLVLTRVTVEVEPRRSGCMLRLAHADVPTAQSGRIASRWAGVLHGLACVLDTTDEVANVSAAAHTRADLGPVHEH